MNYWKSKKIILKWWKKRKIIIQIIRLRCCGYVAILWLRNEFVLAEKILLSKSSKETIIDVMSISHSKRHLSFDDNYQFWICFFILIDNRFSDSIILFLNFYSKLLKALFRKIWEKEGNQFKRANVNFFFYLNLEFVW